MRSLIVVLALFCSFQVAEAQERSFNDNAPGFIRQWPLVGKWSVWLLRKSDGKLACLIVTGVSNAQSGETYFWGLKRSDFQDALVIVDSNMIAVSGDTIRVKIDGASLGVFTVSDRKKDGARTSIASNLNSSASSQLYKLMHLGAKIALSTEHANYEASLEFMPVTLQNFANCNQELKALLGD